MTKLFFKPMALGLIAVAMGLGANASLSAGCCGGCGCSQQPVEQPKCERKCPPKPCAPKCKCKRCTPKPSCGCGGCCNGR